MGLEGCDRFMQHSFPLMTSQRACPEEPRHFRAVNNGPIMHQRSTMRTLKTLILLLTCTGASAQGEWTQALQSSSMQLEGGTASRLCPDNGIVSIGYYRDEAIFGEDTLPGGYPYQNVGFVVKHAADGGVEWARSITNTDDGDWVVVRGLGVDADGNIFVGGTAVDTLLVDGAYAGHNATLPDARAMFVLKFAPSGQLLWSADVEPDAAGAELMGLAVDPWNDVWICGTVSGTTGRAIKLDGADGSLLAGTLPINGQVRQVDVDDAGYVHLRGQSLAPFTLDGITCPVDNTLGGDVTNWTGRFSPTGVAQWFHVPVQGHLGFSPWSAAQQATAPGGQVFVEGYGDMMIGEDTIARGANQRGVYMLDANGTPVWWTRLNRSGMLEVQDMCADPHGGCWITGKCAGVLDLLDTVVTHTGLFAFHIGANGAMLQRVFGPQVERACSVDVAEGLAVFGGEYAYDIQFGEHALTDNLRGVFVARYVYPADVEVPEQSTGEGIRAFPNPARERVHLLGAPARPITVRLFDAVGRELRRWDHFDAANGVLDLTDMPVGTLVLRIGERMIGGTVRLLRLN